MIRTLFVSAMLASLAAAYAEAAPVQARTVDVAPRATCKALGDGNAVVSGVPHRAWGAIGPWLVVETIEDGLYTKGRSVHGTTGAMAGAFPAPVAYHAASERLIAVDERSGQPWLVTIPDWKPTALVAVTPDGAAAIAPQLHWDDAIAWLWASGLDRAGRRWFGLVDTESGRADLRHEIPIGLRGDDFRWDSVSNGYEWGRFSNARSPQAEGQCTAIAGKVAGAPNCVSTTDGSPASARGALADGPWALDPKSGHVFDTNTGRSVAGDRGASVITPGRAEMVRVTSGGEIVVWSPAGERPWTTGSKFAGLQRRGSVVAVTKSRLDDRATTWLDLRREQVLETPEWRVLPALTALAHPEAWEAGIGPALHDVSITVVMEALHELSKAGRFIDDSRWAVGPVRTLLGHDNQSVRGWAAIALSSLARTQAQREEATLVLRPLLGDTNGFVRAAAANGLARLIDLPSIPAIMKLIDDDADCASPPHPRCRVGREAQGALETMTWHRGPGSLVFKSGDERTARVAAEEWYQWAAPTLVDRDIIR
jgi:hypothetical protein